MLFGVFERFIFRVGHIYLPPNSCFAGAIRSSKSANSTNFYALGLPGPANGHFFGIWVLYPNFFLREKIDLMP